MQIPVRKIQLLIDCDEPSCKAHVSIWYNDLSSLDKIRELADSENLCYGLTGTVLCSECLGRLNEERRRKYDERASTD